MHVAAPPNPTRARLIEVVTQVIATSNRNYPSAEAKLAKAVRNDADLLWELFEPFREKALGRILRDTAEQLRRERARQERQLADRETGQATCDSTKRGVSPVGAVSRAGDQSVCVPQDHSGPVSPSRPAGQMAGLRAVATAHDMTYLDSVIINGQPVGDLTPREARAWAAVHRVKARFVELLCYNLPNDLPIRKFRNGEDAKAMMRQAEQEMGGL